MHRATEALITLALQEDAAYGDLTSEAIFEPGHRSRAHIEAREAVVICGLDVARKVFLSLDPAVEVTLEVDDGQKVEAGARVLTATGSTIALLTAERTALNFLQRLSGIATLARRYADTAAALGTGVRVVDTRKTTPGWRGLEKYAVRCGGCHNHRLSLGEHVLIKDNHIAAAGSIGKAVERVRAMAPHTAKIEVEADTLAQVQQALEAGVEVIMLDNMTPARIREAVETIAGRALVEVSGGVTLENLPELAQPGVDVISVGVLTHSARAVDLSMVLQPLDHS